MAESTPSDKDLVDLANVLLEQFHEGIRIQTVDDIGAAFFVTLFEGLFSERLQTIVRRPVTREDEIHNTQVVIDTLASDVIHNQMPHIRGLDIVKGNRRTISDLLEIFQSLAEYLLQNIESDFSIDNEDERVGRSAPPDVNTLKPKLTDDEVFRRDLRWDADDEPVAGFQIRPAGQSRKEAWVAKNGVKDMGIQSTVSSAQQRHTEPGPIHHEKFASNGIGVPGKATDLDKLGHDVVVHRKHMAQDRQLHDENAERDQLMVTDLSDAQQSQSSRFNHIGVRPVVDPHGGTALSTHEEMRLSTRERPPPDVPTGLVSSAASVALVSGHTPNKITSTAVPSTASMTTRHTTVGNSGFSASLPVPSQRQGNITTDNPFRATIGAPSSKKVASGVTTKPYHFSGKTLPPKSRPISDIDITPKKQQQPRVYSEATKLTEEPTSPGFSRDRPSAQRMRSPLTKKNRVQDEAERPFEYTRKVKGLSSSYDNLQNLVSHTAALARQAVQTSPIRLRAERETDLSASPFRTYVGRNADIRYGSQSSKILSTEAGDLASDLNAPSRLPNRHADLSSSSLPVTSVVSPGRGVRKVSFLDDRSLSSGGDLSRSLHTSKEASPISVNKKKIRPTSSQLTGAKYGSYTERGYLSDQEMDNLEMDYRKRHEEVVDDVLSSDNEQNRYTSDIRSKAKPRSTQARLGATKQRVNCPKQRVDRTKQVKFTASSKKPVSRGVLAETRRFLNKENIAQSKKTQYLRDIYSEDYDEFVDDAKEELGETRTLAKQTEAEYKKKVLSGGKTSKPKSVLYPKGRIPPLGVIPVIKKSRVIKPTVSTKARKHSSGSGGPSHRRGSLSLDDEDDLLPLLLEEFPYLYLSESTWHELWRRGISQIERLTRTYEEKRRKKSKAQEQMEEAEKKHQVLTNIVKKQIEHTKRLREIKDRQKQQIILRNKTHERRIQSSRARKYYDEYQVRMRAKMLKRRTREEMIFKNLFKEGLDIQKDRIKEIRQYAKEQRKTHIEKRQNEIDSLENYYRDQFEMLAEKVAKEQKDLVIRDGAQQKVLDQMKKELRKKMENEIQNFQDQLFRDEDDAYFRQLDADRLKHELHMAKYQTKI